MARLRITINLFYHFCHLSYTGRFASFSLVRRWYSWQREFSRAIRCPAGSHSKVLQPAIFGGDWPHADASVSHSRDVWCHTYSATLQKHWDTPAV